MFLHSLLICFCLSVPNENLTLEVAKPKTEPASPKATQTAQRRGFWNHSGTGIYPGDWDRTMRELSDAGFNMILPNLCWGGCAHYASDVLPRSKTYEKYGDQIAQAIAAGKKHGVEVHVWKVCYNLSGQTPKKFLEQMQREKRTVKTVDGKEDHWLCPSHPKNFELERDAMLEIVKKYDVDGIHFDYIRYPLGKYCYCETCRKRFEADSGRKVKNWPKDCYSGERKNEFRKWRCKNVTRLVRAVHEEAKKIKPGVKVSAAVFGSYPSCKMSIGQDWVDWAKAGYVDFLCPMDYTSKNQAFEKLVTRQIKLIHGAVPLYPGIGPSASHSRMDAEQVAAQIALAKKLGAAGFVIFNLSPKEAKRLLPELKKKLKATASETPSAKTNTL